MKIGGREYPMRLTLGAMLRFRRETGKELNETDVSMSMTMLTVLMWCCLVSACQADGVECDLTIEQTWLLACCLLQPWSRKTLRPTDVLRLPWDKKEDVRKTSGAQPVRGDAAEGRDVTEGGQLK